MRCLCPSQLKKGVFQEKLKVRDQDKYTDILPRFMYKLPEQVTKSHRESQNGQF